MIEVLPVETPTLGDRSYLAHDGDVALVVDPQRDIDRVTSLAARLGVRITHVAETHMHNDYVTGGLALSRAASASYLVNAADPVRFNRTRSAMATAWRSARQCGCGLATPGNTFTHLSYVLEAGDEVAGVFTGGSLLYGSTGGPDLLGPDHTETLAHAQYASASGSPVSCPTPRRSTRRTGSAASAPPLRRTPDRPRSASRSGSIPRSPLVSRGTSTRCWPAWTPGPPTTRTWARRTRPGRVALTCRHRAGPVRRRCGARSRLESGSLTCGTGSRSLRASCLARSASRSMAASPPTWAG